MTDDLTAAPAGAGAHRVPPVPQQGGHAPGEHAPGEHAPGEVTLDRVRRPEMRPIGARLVKERTRSMLAVTFAGAFLLTLAASFVGALLKWAPVKDWLQIIMPAEMGLIGSAMGFYFGREHGS